MTTTHPTQHHHTDHTDHTHQEKTMHTTTHRNGRRIVTATVGAAAAVAIAFGTVACGTEVAKEPVPAAPGAIGNAAPFHSSADSIDKGPRNSKFHTSPDGTEHQQKIDEWRGYGYPSYAH